MNLKSQNINYEQEFNWIKKVIEENDAGYKYSLEQKSESVYKVHSADILTKIKNARNDSTFREIVNDWLLFFRNGHIGLELIGNKKNNSKFNSKKEIPNHLNNFDKKLFELLYDSEPKLIELNSNTLYFRIPSFNGKFKEEIDSILKENNSKLLSYPSLIIDIRNNGGGSDWSYKEIIPYLYTNPIREVGVKFYSTKLNNQRMLEIINNPDYHADEKTKEWAKKVYEKLEKNIGEFVFPEDDTNGYISENKLDSIFEFPRNVGIIINNKNASTSEQFLLEAKQSKKVKLFGETTMGVLDISNMNNVLTPSKKFKLWYSLSKSMRLPKMPVDNKGIMPDYYIDESFKEIDWIHFTSKTLNSN
jgi:C-terminal processing protease CtpA/Prc